MPGFVKTEKDEELWSKAKGIVGKQYRNVSSGTNRFYKIVTGVFKKSKGISKSSAIPLRTLLRLGWQASFPAQYISDQMKIQMPGKKWRLYNPMGKVFGKTGSVYREAFEKEAAKINPMIASAAISLGTGMAAYAIPTLLQKATDAIATRRAFNEAKKQFPDLKKFDQTKLKNQFIVIKQMSPTIAKNPYILGSLLRQTVQYEATDPAFLETLARINERMNMPFIQQFSRSLEPYVKEISKQLSSSTYANILQQQKQQQKQQEEGKIKSQAFRTKLLSN